MLQLYSYFQSTCSWRVRIALNLKGLEYEYKAVKYGDQFKPEFLKLNPMGFVPILVDGDMVLADSMAIILYLEEKFPHIPLLPQDPQKRALNFQAASIIHSNIQPYQNAAAKNCFEGKVSPDEKVQWVQYHAGKGLGALETLLEGYAGKYATGDEVFLADLFLAPQIYAAIHRFHLDMLNFPTLMKLNEEYGKIPAFQDAMPDKQPDAVKH